MPKESCIEHGKRSDFIVLRQHMIDLVDGDHCAAVVIDYFEYATNGELDRFARQGITGIPWVSATMASVYEETTHLYSIRRLQERIAWLESIGFLQSEQQFLGSVKKYLLNVEFVNRCLTEKRRFTFTLSIGQMSDDSQRVPSDAPSDAPSDKPTRRASDGAAPISCMDITKERREEEKNELSSLPPSTSTPINPEELTSTLSQKFHRLRKGKGFSAELRRLVVAKLEAIANSCDEETVLSGFDTWTSCVDWAGYDARYRVNSFFAFLQNYDPATNHSHCPAPSQPRPTFAGAPEDTNQHPPVADGTSGLKIGVRGPELPFAATEWNRVVTAGPPVEEWTHRDSVHSAVLTDPEFAAALPKVLERCQKAFETAAQDLDWLNFRYLLRKKDGQDNWYRIKTDGIYVKQQKVFKSKAQEQVETAQRVLERLEARAAAARKEATA